MTNDPATNTIAGEPLAEDQFLRARIVPEGAGAQLREWQQFHNTALEPISVYQFARESIDKFAADVRDLAEDVGMPAGFVLIIEPMVAPD